MFKASLDIKCLSFSIDILSHSYPSDEHRCTASNFFVNSLNSLIIFDPQDGQCFGKLNSFELLSRLSKSTEIT